MIPSEPPQWDLGSVCDGGVDGERFRARMDALTAGLAGLRERVGALGPIAADPDRWERWLLDNDPLELELIELGAFVACASAVDGRAAGARAARSAIDDLRSGFHLVGLAMVDAIDQCADEDFAAFVSRPGIEAARPLLARIRSARRFRLPRELQALKVATDREGLTAWGALYDLVQGTLVGALQLTDGTTRGASAAELGSLRDDPDPAVRAAAFAAKEAAWRTVRDTCAHALTQITGNRLAHNDRRGIDELEHPLHANRVDRSVLDAMWLAVDAARPTLVRYLAHKARCLGQERLAWYDVEAALPGAAPEPAIPWDRAVDTVRSAFGAFHPAMADLVGRAVRERWIDARPAPHRRPGAFCAPAPSSRASRVYLTFSGAPSHVQALAHELGHAYHSQVLYDAPPVRRAMTSALAETASLFGEALVRDALIARIDDPGARAALLDRELRVAVALLMEVPHRFALERELYAMRRTGALVPDALDAATERLQRLHHGDALGSWEPTLWSSKLHFYKAGAPFYNWSYTFGYLFSAALVQRARALGGEFHPAFRELLLRTGWQDTVGIGRDAMGIDLADPAFWRSVVAPLDALCDGFVAATGG